MRSHILCLPALAGFLLAATAASADVCITMDSRDTLAPRDQASAVLIIARQFEQNGEHVVASGCAASYSFSHAQLGNIIVVTIAGPGGPWEATARGLDDLPAVYSQMVRSIVTGRPMSGLNVIDRTNVTAQQTDARRVHTDSIWYARLGYGALNGDRAYGTPALGFGYRAELDSFAIDVASLNVQFSSREGFSAGSNAAAQSLVKLSGFRYLAPTSNRSAYVGGGLSYGRTHFGS